MNAARIATVDTSEGSRFTDVALGDSRPALHLDVLREMLATMDTLTEAGQRYTMAKLVAFIRGRIPAIGLVLSPRNEAAVDHLLERLDLESTGVVVDAPRFVTHAGALLDLLDAVVPRRAVLHFTGRPSMRAAEDQRTPGPA